MTNDPGAIDTVKIVAATGDRDEAAAIGAIKMQRLSSEMGHLPFLQPHLDQPPPFLQRRHG